MAEKSPTVAWVDVYVVNRGIVGRAFRDRAGNWRCQGRDFPTLDQVFAFASGRNKRRGSAAPRPHPSAEAAS